MLSDTLSHYQRSKIKNHTSDKIEDLITHLIEHSSARGLANLTEKLNIEFDFNHIDDLVGEFTKIIYSYDIKTVSELHAFTAHKK